MTLKPGAELGPRRIDPVDSEAMCTLAEILGDPNPIHLDAAAARAAGLGDRPVNQGPANFGYVLDMLRSSIPEGHVVELHVRLLGSVFAGDSVVAGGRIDSVDWVADAAHASCTVWLDVEDGQRALTGTAVLKVPQARATPTSPA